MIFQHFPWDSHWFFMALYTIPPGFGDVLDPPSSPTAVLFTKQLGSLKAVGKLAPAPKSMYSSNELPSKVIKP